MQPLTAAPYRSQYSNAQILALLRSVALQVQYGLDLLDQNNNWLEDISGDLLSFDLERDCTATIHGTGTFVVTRQLQGGWQRVRPYCLLSGAGLENVRFDLGVYVLTSPVAQFNEDPVSYSITGSDLLYILDTTIGDTYTVPAGTTYLAAAQAAANAAGLTGSTVYLDGSSGSLTLPNDLVFPLNNGYGAAFTYLDVINQLLAAINYIGIWADWEGNLRSGPYLAPTQLQPEYAFDLTLDQGIEVEDPRTLTNDLWQAPNNWLFINENVSGPVVGAGIYQYTNQSWGPSSVDAVGRTITDVVYLNAADQATLEGLAKQQINQAIQLVDELSVKLSPFPVSWHLDVVTVNDPKLVAAMQPPPASGIATCQGQTWSLASDGSDGAQTWQIIGAPLV